MHILSLKGVEMKGFIKCLYRSIPWKVRDYINFYRAFGRLPAIYNPKTFNEKILNRKRTDCINNPYFTVLADKFFVRNYVKAKIGDGYLVPLIDVFDHVDELKSKICNYSDCVIKPNHGAGMFQMVNNHLDKESSQKVMKKVSDWMKHDFYKVFGELQYKTIKRKILVEEMICDRGQVPTDYKVHIFKKQNGDYSYVLQLIDDRLTGSLTRTFYVNNIDTPYSGEHFLIEEDKKIISEAISLSNILVDDLNYARVDWYLYKGKLYFGEITLTPAAGVGTGYGKELDMLMGNEWRL